MPYTAAQNRLFRAASHNTAIAKAHGMTKSDAQKMAAEGVKKNGAREKLAAALKGRS